MTRFIWHPSITPEKNPSNEWGHLCVDNIPRITNGKTEVYTCSHSLPASAVSKYSLVQYSSVKCLRCYARCEVLGEGCILDFRELRIWMGHSNLTYSSVHGPEKATAIFSYWEEMNHVLQLWGCPLVPWISWNSWERNVCFESLRELLSPYFMAA